MQMLSGSLRKCQLENNSCSLPTDINLNHSTSDISKFRNLHRFLTLKEHFLFTAFCFKHSHLLHHVLMNALKPPKHFIKRVTWYFWQIAYSRLEYENVYLHGEIPTAFYLLDRDSNAKVCKGNKTCTWYRGKNLTAFKNKGKIWFFLNIWVYTVRLAKSILKSSQMN